jgi:predicted RNA binding protein YcfA (HicA-like mRNA interferase family)
MNSVGQAIFSAETACCAPLMMCRVAFGSYRENDMSFQTRKVLKALLRRGFRVLREGANHTIVRRDADGVQIAVPRHREIKRPTARGMAMDAKVDWDEFKREVS